MGYQNFADQLQHRATQFHQELDMEGPIDDGYILGLTFGMEVFPYLKGDLASFLDGVKSGVEDFS